MSADATLAEALARIEHKLDCLLRQQSVFWQSMDFPTFCPICKKQVEYQVDLMDSIVKRLCGCSTGKLPPLVPFLPVPPTGVPDGRQPRRDAGPAEPPLPEHGDRSQGR